MRINKESRRLRVNRKPTEDINPMESVANLADVMLVFACGLLIALIAAWNVDVTRTNERWNPADAAILRTEDCNQSGDPYCFDLRTAPVLLCLRQAG